MLLTCIQLRQNILDWHCTLCRSRRKWPYLAPNKYTWPNSKNTRYPVSRFCEWLVHKCLPSNATQLKDWSVLNLHAKSLGKTDRHSVKKANNFVVALWPYSHRSMQIYTDNHENTLQGIDVLSISMNFIASHATGPYASSLPRHNAEGHILLLFWSKAMPIWMLCGG